MTGMDNTARKFEIRSFPDELRDRLRVESAMRKRSMSAIVVEAVEEKLRKEGKAV